MHAAPFRPDSYALDTYGQSTRSTIRGTNHDHELSSRRQIFDLNAGLSVDSSFHIIGTIFDTVMKEGVMLKKGNGGNGGSQVGDLALAQGAIVEFSLAEAQSSPTPLTTPAVALWA